MRPLNIYSCAERDFDVFTDEGLEKNGTTMSQIPTYVTAVPDGTEKVGRLHAVPGAGTDGI